MKRHLVTLLALMTLLLLVMSGCASTTTDTANQPESTSAVETQQSTDTTQTTEATEQPVTAEPKKLVLAHDYQTEHPIHIAAMEFADAINSSGLNMQCEVYPNGTLYQSNWDILIEMLQSNTVQAGVDSITVFSSVVQNMSALQLPFMFANTEQLQKLIESKPELIEKWKQEALEKDLVIGSINAKSFRQLINNKMIIKTPDDIANLKFRVPNNPFFITVFEALGTKPVPMPSGEIYSAIQLGTVVGEDNPIPNVYDSKTYEVAKYYTIWDYIADGDVLVFSKDFYDSLTLEEKTVVDAAAEQYGKTMYALNEDFKNKATETMKEAGVEFYYMTEAEKQPFKEMMATLYAEKQDTMGADWDLLMAAIDAIK